jgi:hypothetical protein
MGYHPMMQTQFIGIPQVPVIQVTPSQTTPIRSQMVTSNFQIRF